MNDDDEMLAEHGTARDPIVSADRDGLGSLDPAVWGAALADPALADVRREAAADALDALLAKVRAASKGESGTWGLVALVHEMADEVKRDRAAALRAGGPDGR